MKDLGVLRLIYGDYWTRRKASTVLGFIIPLGISILLVDVTCSLLTWTGRAVLSPTELLDFVAQSWPGYLWAWFLGLTLVYSAIWYLTDDRFLARFLMQIIQLTRRDMFERHIAAQDHSLILLKNFASASAQNLWGFVGVQIVRFVGILLLVPSLLVGVEGYAVLPLSAGSALDPLKDIPLVDYLMAFANWVVISTQSQPPTLKALLLLAFVVLLSAVLDLIRCAEQRTLRGGSRQITQRGLHNLILDLCFPRKLGGLGYLTLAGLFSDRRTISLDIPVLSENKLFEAMQEELGEAGSKRCVTMKMPMLDPNMVTLLRSLPEEMKNEVMASMQPSGVKLLRSFLKSERSRKWLGRYTKHMEQDWQRRVSDMQRRGVIDLSFVCSVAEDGVSAYAFLMVPPATHRCRIVRRLWCSDYELKASIVRKVEYR